MDDEKAAAEFEHQMQEQGVAIVDGGSIEDAPDDALLAVYAQAESPGQKRYVASLLLDRGSLRGCGCEGCSQIRVAALEWKKFVEAHPEVTEEE